MREKICIDEGWLFHKGDIIKKLPVRPIILTYISAKTEREHFGPACKDYFAETDPSYDPDSYNDDVVRGEELWTRVDLPHDYVISGIPAEKENNVLGCLARENAWYIKKFSLSENDRNKRITLIFEGVGTCSVIYVNSVPMKYNYSSYNTFEVDITDVVFYDKQNTVSVYIDNSAHEGWYYEGAGIHRSVYLVKTDLVSVDMWGLYVNPQPAGGNMWTVRTSVTVRNDSDEGRAVKLFTYIIDDNNDIVSTAITEAYIEFRSVTDVKFDIEIDDPRLWSPENPILYQVKTKIFCNNVCVDEYRDRFGFRSFFVDKDKGLFINGKNYKIKGICAHDMCGLTGMALSDNVRRHKIKLLKEMGANGYRAAHYMQAASIMNALDESGFIVMAENRHYDTSEETIKQLTSLVKRDRNRPSIFFWSLGNEEPCQANDEGIRIFNTLKGVVRKLDDSRIIMSAVTHYPLTSDFFEHSGIVSLNYHIDDYEKMRERYPDKPFLSSENTSVHTTRGEYLLERDREKLHEPAYDFDRSDGVGRESTWKFIAERDWIMGGYQWVAFDHKGENTWPRLCFMSGSVDLFYQKKDAYYQNKSLWTEFKDQPVLHLLPHWNLRVPEGEPVKAVAYTNAPEAELFINGKSCGRQKISAYGHAEWTVPYRSGKIEAVGYDVNGKAVIKDERTTTGKPVRLMLRTETGEFAANGKDTVIMSCYCVDENGLEVPDAEPTVSFTAEGAGTFYSSGAYPHEHDTVCNSVRKMYAGRIGIAVKTGKKQGEIKVTAKAENLISAVCRIKVRD